MASPFPGMDPYLEQAIFWSEFHSRLIVAIADALALSLLPQYYVAVETRTYRDDPNEELLVGIPDAVVLSTPGLSAQAKREIAGAGVATTVRPQSVILPMPLEIKERYLEIREAGSDAVITVVEVLSPTHKRQGGGRRIYSTKRQTVLGSASHLVEIDLLRAHDPMAMHPVDIGAASTARYRILVSRSEHRPRADLYEFVLREPIPEFPLPLKETGEQVIVGLQPLVNGIYERSGYGIRVDYQASVPPPALSAEDQAWVNELLHSR
ncbi:DUF4058 family protein [Synechococcales cyanobacterium C]|uniref:DUF4058 family protein n=1 Tax=Petrachloros mirabilis ULC683 TaxID=2781853 RepID=A0A8K1ZXI2_9CYAN|nr:DUF4058 family protein [Petrachloros mirabilis]NCJ05892.1 DUF4058 family protein [Petrachloros mirabilis ULC683]